MRGNELLDKLELIDPAYVEAADREERKRRPWVRWGAAAACFAAVLLAGALALRAGPPRTVTVSIGGIAREYKNAVTPETLSSSLVWPWEYLTTQERYSSMELNGTEYYLRGRTLDMALDPSLLDGLIGPVQLTGYDSYTEQTHSMESRAYRVRGIAEERLVAVELDGEYCVFFHRDYDPPAVLGEVLDQFSLAENLPLKQFTRESRGGYETSGTFRLEDDGYIWEVLSACRDAEFVEDDRWHEAERTYLCFTATSQALGIQNLVFYVTDDGYIWTNAFDYGYIFRIGEEAAGQIIAYAAEHSTACDRERYSFSLAGTLTGIEDGFLLINDGVLCADPAGGMTFRVPLDDVRISRCIDFEGIGVGELVVVSFTGGVDAARGNVVEGAYSLERGCLSEEGVYMLA